jgi:hypothetical protein
MVRPKAQVFQELPGCLEGFAEREGTQRQNTRRRRLGIKKGLARPGSLAQHVFRLRSA